MASFAATSFAAPVFVQFSVTSPIYNILGGGEFTGHINGGSAISIFCDDYQNTTHTNPYAAYISDSTNYQLDTRFGATASTNFAFLANAGITALDRYTMAGWLTTKYTFPTTPTADDLAIQTAIWTLLAQNGAPSKPNPGGNTVDQTKVNYWLTQATTLKTTNLAMFTTIQSELRIVTSADVAGAGNRYLSGQQEYLYLTPEPTTIVLAGCGLAALAFLRKRRA